MLLFRSFVVLTSALRAELERVHTHVNGTFQYVTDQEQYGRADFAVEIDEGGGDCEDYALRKRTELIKLGWPAAALNIGICTITDGNGIPWWHAVLIVHTSEADLCLDSYRDNKTIKALGDVPENYTWKKITSSGDFPIIAGVLRPSVRMSWFWFGMQRVRRFLKRTIG